MTEQRAPLTLTVSRSRRAVFVVLLVGIGLLVVLIAQTALGTVEYGWGETLFYGGALAYFLTLGAVIVWKVPGNRIGWLFALMAVSLGIAGVSGGVADRGIMVFHAIGGAAWTGWIGSIFLLLNWYPTGRSSSGVWAWVGRLTALLIGFAVIATLFAEQQCVEAGEDGCEIWADNPIGITGIPYPEHWEPFGLVILLVLVLSLAALFARFRRADVIQRLQLKWFLLAGAAFVASILLEAVFHAAGRRAPIFVAFLNGAALLAIPIAATLAILRYRLYDIDRIISRTVSYALVVGVLGLVVLALVTLFATFLPSDDPLVVAVSTLAAAALFNPVRRRVQALIDRRFNRSRYDAQRVVGSFTETLQEQVDPEEVVEGWVEVVQGTMQPAAVGYWVRDE